MVFTVLERNKKNFKKVVQRGTDLPSKLCNLLKSVTSVPKFERPGLLTSESISLREEGKRIDAPQHVALLFFISFRHASLIYSKISWPDIDDEDAKKRPHIFHAIDERDQKYSHLARGEPR